MEELITHRAKTYEELDRENYYLRRKNRNRRQSLNNLQKAYDSLLYTYKNSYEVIKSERAYSDKLKKELLEALSNKSKGLRLFSWG